MLNESPQTYLDPATLDPGLLLERLQTELCRYESLIVAFSGGVDSGVLLAAAVRIPGFKVIALTADSPSMPRHELEEAVAFATAFTASKTCWHFAQRIFFDDFPSNRASSY